MEKQLVLVLSGKKQSGKNTLANFIIGRYLIRTNQISEFRIMENGCLLTSNRIRIISEGAFNDCGYEGIKLYSFADPLKSFCMEVLGLTYEQCYGSDEEKNTFTFCKWDNISEKIKLKYGFKSGYMMARQVLQIFGTDMVRTMLNDAWPTATYIKIKKEKKKLAIITDGRFPNEIEIGKNCGAISIRLMRDICKKDNHPSETALDDYKEFDKIFDNRTTSIEEQNEMVKPFLDDLFKKYL